MNVISKRRRQKLEQKDKHTCAICAPYHPHVQKVHGYLLRRLNRYLTDESLMKYTFWKMLWDDLTEYERELDTWDKRAKAFDRRMATSRDVPYWWAIR